MEVLRHKHPADQQKAGGFSDFGQRIHKAAAATLRPKQRRPYAGGDESQFARNVGKPAACHGPAVYASRLSQDQSLRDYADTTKQASAPATNIANTQKPSVSVARGACDKIAPFFTQKGASCMAEIYPFRALHYNSTAIDLQKVVTQPYDKISPEMRTRYYATSPYNF